MSEPTVMSADASNLHVVTALRGWLNLRCEFTEETPVEAFDLVIGKLSEGSELVWSTLSELLWTYDLVRSLRHHRIGLWSNIRTRSGKEWTAIPTITRAVRQHLVRMPATNDNSSTPGQFHGLGCVALEPDGLWLADHVLYATKDCLEPSDDYRFYGYAKDPDFSDMKPMTHEWGYVQSKWFTKVGGTGLRAGWINSPRYAFAVRAHKIPRESLMASAPGKALWATAAEVSALCPATVTDSPEPWWQDRTLFPSREMLWSWASSARRQGYGIQSQVAIKHRDVGDPCAIPALLNSIAPGQPPREQLWELFLLVHKLTCALNGPTREADGRTTWEMDFSPDAALLIEKGHNWAVASTSAFVAHLMELTLLPKYSGHSQSDPVPHKSVLKGGLLEILAQNAIPVRLATQNLDRSLNGLSWAWSTSGGRPFVPPGFMPVGREQVEEALRDPVEPELGSNLESFVSKKPLPVSAA